jgi:hypothetical protein
MANENQTTIESAEQFDKNPAGQATRWAAEMQAADKEVERWLKESQKVVDRFLDKRSRAATRKDSTRLNLFNANVTTIRSMLYGQIPAVDVKRRFDDQADDPARVAATIMERLLNNDMRRDDDSYREVLRYCLDDWLIVGLGVGRVRYEAEFEEVEMPAMTSVDELGNPVELAPAYTEQRKVWEDAPIDYTGWRDVRWSPARTWGEVRWIGFRSYLTEDQVRARFGDKVAKAIPYEQKPTRNTGPNADSMEFDTWKRAGVWEIWSKDDRRVYWWVKDYGQILDGEDDPLELEGFWPCPKFLIANETTSSLVPLTSAFTATSTTRSTSSRRASNGWSARSRRSASTTSLPAAFSACCRRAPTTT